MDNDQELKEELSVLLTGGVHYYELTDSFLNDGTMSPDFAARHASDVAEDIDKLASFIKSREERLELSIRVDELKRAASHNNSEYTSDYLEGRIVALTKTQDRFGSDV